MSLIIGSSAWSVKEMWALDDGHLEIPHLFIPHVYFPSLCSLVGIPNAVWTNQFDNVDNRLAHFETTGEREGSSLGLGR